MTLTIIAAFVVAGLVVVAAIFWHDFMRQLEERRRADTAIIVAMGIAVMVTLVLLAIGGLWVMGL